MDQPTQPIVTPTPSPVPTPAPSSPKKWWLIGGIVAAVLVLLGLGAWWWSASQQDAYVKGASAYEQNLKSAFNFYKNSTDTEKQRNDIQNKFDAALASRPQEPNLLGIPLPAPSATKERIAQLTEPFRAMRDGFVDLHDFNAFADKALTVLDSLGPPVYDLKGNQAKYKEAASKLRALKGPGGVSDFKSQKAEALEKLAAAMAAADSHTDPQSYSSAMAEIDSLAPEVTAKTAVGELQKIYRTYYDGLAKEYEATAEVLGVEG